MTPGRLGKKPTRAELYSWLEEQILCVVATQGEGGYPNVATVAFSQTKDLSFIIITDRSSRKAVNITKNPRVAMTITNEDERHTLQLEGDARQLSWEEFDLYSEHHYKKLPFSLPFKDIPGQTPFLIEPVRMKFSDVSVRPWEVTEYSS